MRHVDGSLAPQKLNEVLRIWLDGNIEALPFVPAGYWQRNYKAVRMSLQQADLYHRRCPKGHNRLSRLAGRLDRWTVHSL
jgi:hypothetical protein